VYDNLRQLLLGQVKALGYSRYDINEYCFRIAKLEANSGVVANGEDASRLAADNYGILQKFLSTRLVVPTS
jgi:hypothetical protein